MNCWNKELRRGAAQQQTQQQEVMTMTKKLNEQRQKMNRQQAPSNVTKQ